jgi:Carboxypeptidase regulatory-like domain
MKKTLGTIGFLLFALNGLAWQFQLPIGGSSSSSGSDGHKATRVTSRTLTGVVLEKAGDAPVSNAVVYLKNMKSLAVKTVIAANDGTYRFPELSPNVDYEVYAQREGKKSDTKVLSQFDDRQKANIVLRINMNK